MSEAAGIKAAEDEEAAAAIEQAAADKTAEEAQVRSDREEVVGWGRGVVLFRATYMLTIQMFTVLTFSNA